MRYTGMPAGMWILFGRSFQKQLSLVYGYDPETAAMITSNAKQKYREIIHHLPEFETAPMKWFCRMSGKRKFSEQDLHGMAATAAFRAADRNPYSWNMEFLPYPDGSGYEARFTKCGICTLMQELGLQDQIPAMCHLDYTMSEAGGVSEFVRTYTLASGGPYCDCGYKRKDGYDEIPY